MHPVKPFNNTALFCHGYHILDLILAMLLVDVRKYAGKHFALLEFANLMKA